ncbi:CLUMA_CG001902, isoform A [Clunio marinus]|uniref:CLUMA_CG001902, isoform A n=1 Tax=Clunio marinus TaxID=568069 RepID=A0A1J1HJB7_9DIPT|nr:CLUMA_CG001902, isoform A [Clunio marinus]
MSLTSKFVFGSCCAVTFGTIGYVHWKQNFDRKKLKEGVVRDVERQRVREMNKSINTYNLQQQKELEKVLRREENKQFANET